MSMSSFYFVHARDEVVCEGDSVIFALNMYGVEANARGTVLALNGAIRGGDETVHVRWDEIDALALDLEPEWRWVNVQYVVDVVRGLAPKTPQR